MDEPRERRDGDGGPDGGADHAPGRPAIPDPDPAIEARRRRVILLGALVGAAVAALGAFVVVRYSAAHACDGQENVDSMCGLGALSFHLLELPAALLAGLAGGVVGAGIGVVAAPSYEERKD